MAEGWIGAAVAIGGAMIKGYSDGKAAEEAAAEGKLQNKKDYAFDALKGDRDAERQDYYNQLQRERKQRGLAELRKFSTVSAFAPDYRQDVSVEAGPAPSVTDYIDKLNAIDKLMSEPKKKKKGIFEKLSDPLGIGDKIGFNPSLSAMLESGGDSVLGKASDREAFNAAAAQKHAQEQEAARKALDGSGG